MNKRFQNRSYRISFWTAALCLLLCAGLFTVIFQISTRPASAAVIEVRPVSGSDYQGQFGPNNDEVYRVELDTSRLSGPLATANWTIENIVQEDNSYKDSDGNFYVLAGVVATMTIHCDVWVINTDPNNKPMGAFLPDKDLNNFSLAWESVPGTTFTCNIPSFNSLPDALYIEPLEDYVKVAQTSPKDNQVVCVPDFGCYTSVVEYDYEYFSAVSPSNILVSGAGVTAENLTYVQGMYGSDGSIYDGYGEFYAAPGTLVIRAPAGKLISEVYINDEFWPGGARDFTFDNSTRNLGYPDSSPHDPDMIDMKVIVADDPNGGGEIISPEEPVIPPDPEDQIEDPPVRVVNNMNVPGLSSDTILWPSGSKQDGRICYVTVSDRELDALIELANAHERDADGMDGDGYKEGIIYIDGKKGSKKKDIATYRVTFTEEQFDHLAEVDWDRLTIATPIGRFSIYDDAIRQAAETGDGDVAFRLQTMVHEGRPGLDVSLIIERKEIKQFDQPYGARIFIPYELQEGEDPNAIVMEYIHDDGTKELVTECYYDADARGVYFFSSHLSKFGVVYRPSAFSDVGPKHWANPYVTFLASRGVINGGTGGGFRPDDTATRAEFIHVMSKALSAAQLPKHPLQVYNDIPVQHFAARAADWVFFNNLDGPMTQGSNFNPSASITRQDAATLINNAAIGSNLRVRSRGKESDFTDLNSAASYARTPVQRLAQAGILKMNESHKFFPTRTMSRGEMAQIIATFLSSL